VVAYLHVMRQASHLFDDGATYSNQGVLGALHGRRAGLRLVRATRAHAPLEAGEVAMPYWTRVEVALDPAAPVGLTLEERAGPAAALVRGAWLDGALEPDDFAERFDLFGPGAPGPLGSTEARARLLRAPRLRVRVLARVEPDEQPDPYGTLSSDGARAHLAGAPIVVVEWPDISEGEDLNRLVNLSTFLGQELTRPRSP
jgi:hypothetical protein